MTACTYTFMASLGQLEIELAIRLVLNLKSGFSQRVRDSVPSDDIILH